MVIVSSKIVTYYLMIFGKTVCIWTVLERVTYWIIFHTLWWRQLHYSAKFIKNLIDSTDHDILDAKIGPREMKIQCPEMIIIGHLNINSIRNKFDALSFITDTNIDILLISETKLNDSFLSAQFRLKGFCTPYRIDRNSKGGGFLSYFREDIPLRFLGSGSTCNI